MICIVAGKVAKKYVVTYCGDQLAYTAHVRKWTDRPHRYARDDARLCLRCVKVYYRQ